jgi:hypothetical protein
MMINYVRSDQQENKSSVLPHLLFYRNVSVNLIVHICILAIHTRFIGCLPLEKSIMYTGCLTKNASTHDFFIYYPISMNKKIKDMVFKRYKTAIK